MESTLWRIEKQGRQVTCTVKPLAGGFRLTIVYEGSRITTHVCPRQRDVRQWATDERGAWLSNGWEPAS